MEKIAKHPSARLAAGWLTVFVVGTDLFVVSPLLPSIGAAYNVSAGLAGLCVTAFAVAYMILAPLLGHLADRIGQRRILILGLAAFAAANLATALAGSLAEILLARLCAGAAAAGVSPSVYALVGALAPPQRRATWLSLVVSGLLLSLTLGAPMATLLGAAFGWRSVLTGLAAASLALVWANRRAWPRDPPARGTAGPGTRPRPLDVAARLAPMVAWSTALYGMYTYLGAGLAAAGFTTPHIARIVVVYGVGAILGLLLGGRLADLLGTRATGGIGLFGLFVALWLLRLAIDRGLFAEAAFALTSAGAQLFFPAQQAGLVNDFPAHRATLLAWNNSMLFLGISLGSVIGGVAVTQGGFAADLSVSAAVALLGWALHQVVVPRPMDRRAPARGQSIAPSLTRLLRSLRPGRTPPAGLP